MLNSIKISLKDTLIYGLGNIAVKIVGLILIPLFTNPKYFSIDEFGVMGVLEISALVITAFLASALPQSLTRWFWDKEHIDNQKGIFFMTLIVQLVISIVCCIVLIPLSGTISDLIFSKPGLANLITLVILGSAIQAVNNIINTLMRLQSRSSLYTVANLFKLVSVLLLTLYFILSRKMGLEGIYLAQVIGNSLFVIVLLGYTAKNSRVYFDRSVLVSMSSYGFPLLVANISTALLTVIDRFALNSLALLKSVALYTLAFKITSVLKLVIADSIKLALGPMMFKWMERPDNKRFYSKVLLYSSYVMMFAIVGISLFSYEVIKVITTSKQYWEAVVIIPILSLSVFFGNMKDITVYGLHFVKKTRIIGLIIILTTLLSLALNILFIPFWDITGAALATLLSQIVYWFACYYFSQRAFFVPYENRKIAILFLVGGALSFLSMKLNGMDLLPRLVLKSISLISFPFILYLAGFYEKIELQSIKGFVIKWSNLSKFKDNLKSLKDVKDEV
jgi:O-antigen/teichoic acid export membrane protein